MNGFSIALVNSNDMMISFSLMIEFNFIGLFIFGIFASMFFLTVFILQFNISYSLWMFLFFIHSVYLMLLKSCCCLSNANHLFKVNCTISISIYFSVFDFPIAVIFHRIISPFHLNWMLVSGELSTVSLFSYMRTVTNGRIKERTLYCGMHTYENLGYDWMNNVQTWEIYT